MAFLQGCNAILHAGDIGDPRILEELGGIAPLIAVRGNNDPEAMAPLVQTKEFLGKKILVVHDIVDAHSGYDVVVTGHSHRPRIEERNGTLYVNPGSAGPRRFSLPISVGELLLVRGEVRARLQALGVSAAGRRRA